MTEETWPSNAHLKWVGIAAGATFLLSLLVPPAFVLFMLVGAYWCVLFFIGLLRILISGVRSAPARTPKPPPRAYPSSPSPPEGWQEQWLAKCESPAEAAFLRSMIPEFLLLPAGTRLNGQIYVSLQERIAGMRVDFLLGRKLAVEIDGAAYHSTARERSRDFRRDEKLKAFGYAVMRIPAAVVLYQPRDAMHAVRSELQKLRLV